MSDREIEASDISVLYEVFARRAVEAFNETKQILPQLAVVKLGTEPGTLADAVFVDPRMVNEMQKNGHRKDLLMRFVRIVLDERLHNALQETPLLSALPFRPDLIVHVSEVWTINSKAPNPDGIEPKDHPDRGEAILVVLHTREQSYGGISPITGSNGNRVATYEPLAGKFDGSTSLIETHGIH